MKKVLLIVFMMVISFSGCSRLPENGIHPVQSMNSDTSSPSSVDSTTTTTSSQNNDLPWIKAYYNYIKHNDFNPETNLIDLNFDGTPELLDCQYAEGSRYYDVGISYLNGEVVSFDVGEVSDFVGTYIKSDGSKSWYTRSFPFSLHHWPSTDMKFFGIDYSSLPNVAKNELLEITFNNTNDDKNLSVSLMKNGKNTELTSSEYTQYKTWYANANTGADTLILLPYIKELESGLNCTPQKQVKTDFTKHGMDMTKLEYEDFRTEMLKWNAN